MIKPFSLCSAVLLCLSSLHADDTLPPAPPPVPVEADPDLPQPFDYSGLQTLVTQSPFSRTVSFENTYQLTGIAHVDGHPIATILNRETKQRFMISQEPNAQGWQLLAAATDDDPQEGYAEIQVGTETVTLHMNPANQLLDAASKKEGKKMLLASGSGGSKIRPSNFLGERGKEMYASLSSKARDKFRELIESRLTKHPEQTNEQTSDYARKVFAKIKASDSSSSGSSVKTTKPSKKKQGA